jgi:hypothetical protein
MHAKMTRDRKKLFISSVEKTIAELEQKNKRMRDILAKQAVQYSQISAAMGGSKSITPEQSPMLVAIDAPTSSSPLSPIATLAISDSDSVVSIVDEQKEGLRASIGLDLEQEAN